MLSSMAHGRALLRQECVYNQGRGLLVTTGTWMEEKLTLLPHNNPRKPPSSAKHRKDRLHRRLRHHYTRFDDVIR